MIYGLIFAIVFLSCSLIVCEILHYKEVKAALKGNVDKKEKIGFNFAPKKRIHRTAHKRVLENWRRAR